MERPMAQSREVRSRNGISLPRRRYGLRLSFVRPIGVLVLFLVPFAGCGGGELQVAQLDVRRSSWDTLRVDLAFAVDNVVAASTPVSADSVVLRVFDSDYALLYEGSGTTVPVPDATLASRERITLEACGTVDGATVCDQRMMEASPKRVRFREGLTYPRHGQFDRGAYDFAFVLERQRFASEKWEPVPGAEVSGAYLVASVEGQPETAVRVPVSGTEGQFDLSEYENYPEFEFRILRALERRDAVPVRIELFSGLEDDVEPLASLERIVREKTREERESELEQFVRLAAERLLERFEPYDRARAHVRDWRFDPDTRRYEIRLSLSWGHLFFGRRIVTGDLDVNEDGTGAVFTQRGLNREARRPWRQRVGDDRVVLGTLEWEEVEPVDSAPGGEEIARRL